MRAGPLRCGTAAPNQLDVAYDLIAAQMAGDRVIVHGADFLNLILSLIHLST